MALHHIKTVEEFEEKVVKADKPVLVDFYASWCGPCKMVAPELEALAPELEGKAEIVKIDVEEVPEVARVVGFRPRADLKAMVEKTF